MLATPESRLCIQLIYYLLTGKEARKKELKKNKRQRQMVRAAVLKGKDPTQLIVEMEKMDQMGEMELKICRGMCS